MRKKNQVLLYSVSSMSDSFSCETHISILIHNEYYLKYSFLIVQGSAKCSPDKSTTFRGYSATIQKNTQYQHLLEEKKIKIISWSSSLEFPFLLGSVSHLWWILFSLASLLQFSSFAYVDTETLRVRHLL